MTDQPGKRTSVFLDDEDIAAIERLQARYGLGTASAAIRFALRVLDHSGFVVVPAPGEEPPRPSGREAA